MVSGSNLIIANINDHYKLIWSLTLELITISQDTHKLTKTNPDIQH